VPEAERRGGQDQGHEADPLRDERVGGVFVAGAPFRFGEVDRGDGQLEQTLAGHHPSHRPAQTSERFDIAALAQEREAVPQIGVFADRGEVRRDRLVLGLVEDGSGAGWI
jgi:hypothetical protein